MRKNLLPSLGILALSLASAGAPTGARAADWPGWRGPARTGVTTEASGWDGQHWNLTERWQAEVGPGMAASPIIADGHVYAMGRAGDSDQVICLDLATGATRWRQTNACRSDGRFRKGESPEGPTCTPTFDAETGYLYTLGNDGDLFCRDTHEGGRQVWHFNLYDTFAVTARQSRTDQDPGRDYGYCGNVLLWEDTVLVEVGSTTAGNVMAFDKRTGKRRWTSEDRNSAGHNCGPVLFTVEGTPCVASFTLEGLRILRADAGHEGRDLAWLPWSIPFNVNHPTPSAWDNHVLITGTADYKSGLQSTFVELTLKGIRRTWNGVSQSFVCSPVHHAGSVYLVNERGRLSCMDPNTGDLVWEGGAAFGGVTGSIIATGDDKLIVWGDTRLVLAEATPRASGSYRELARLDAPLPKRKGMGNYQPHPALGAGSLILRNKSGRLICYATQTASAAPPAAAHPAPVRATIAEAEPTTAATAAETTAKATVGERVFAWNADDAGTRDGESTAASPFALRGNARIAPGQALEFSGGAALVQGVDDALLNACRQANALTISITLQPAHLAQEGPARIVTFSQDAYNRNFMLGQVRDRLVLRLRTPRTGPNGMNPEITLCTLTAGREHRILVAYRPGQLDCHVDGVQVLTTDRVQGGFENWEPMHLLLGDEWDGDRSWAGRIRDIAIHSRWLDADEAANQSPRRKEPAATPAPQSPARQATPPPPASSTPAAPPPRPQPGPATPRAGLPSRGVQLEENVPHAGQASVRIATPTGVYYYHNEGSGFASLLDADGNDWIGSRPGGGSAGEYRGIPNLVVRGGLFHPGTRTGTSRLETVSSNHVRIVSTSEDGLWEVAWDAYERFATLTVVRSNGPYWFLYEGTPGGRLDVESQACIRADGARTPLSQAWTGDIAGTGDGEWAAFTDGKRERSLLLVHHTDDTLVDSYWPMQNNMTVFGFGRQGMTSHLTRTPARFTIALVDTTDPAALAAFARALPTR